MPGYKKIDFDPGFHAFALLLQNPGINDPVLIQSYQYPISNPLKVKVVDDCPSYQFTEKSANLDQSAGDVCLVLSSQIAAVGKQISWESTPLLPGSIWQSSGKTTVRLNFTNNIDLILQIT